MKALVAIPIILLAGCHTSTDLSGAADGAADAPEVPPDAPPDGIGPACAPQAVSDDLCWECEYAASLGFFWDGVECFELFGCDCRGEGCEPFETLEECEAAHAECASTLCTETGGAWIPDAPCGPCGHFTCGLPPDLDCCSAGCDCGPGRTFEHGEGCRADPSCEKPALCRASGGTWYPDDPCGPCGDYVCGVPPAERCCSAGCDCGPGRTYAEGAGCLADPDCDPTAEDLCVATGGTWHPDVGCGPCGHWACGDPPLDACCAEGCECPGWAVFVEGEGCATSTSCLLRSRGESCVGLGADSNCRPGLACCASAGGPWYTTCTDPCCPEFEWCREDGCPPPPP
jgi:hypothetical protein